MIRVSKAFVLATVVALASGTFMGSALAVLSRFLIEEFSLSNAQFGLLATASTLGSAIGAYFIGRIADRTGGRRLLRVHFALCLIGVVAAALAPNYLWLLATVGVVGLVSASANPATNRLIAVSVPARSRSAVVGVKATGQPLSIIAAGALLPTAALAWGWRGGLLVGVLFPILGMALMPSVPPDEPEESSDPTASAAGYRTTILWVAAHGFCVGGGAAAVVAFLPLFGQEAIGLTPTAAGALLSLAGLMSVVGRLVWGRIAGRVTHVSRSMVWLSATSIISTVFLILSGGMESVPLLWMAAAASGFTMMSWNSVGMSAVVAEVDVGSAGRASGAAMSAFLAGWMVTPSIFGWTLDLTGSFLVGWAIVLGLHAAALAAPFLWTMQRSKPKSAEPVI